MPIGVDEIRSLSAVWNQHEVLNVINPKEKYTLRVIIKRSESASSLVNERAQIAPRAFRQRRNIARSAAVLTASEQGVCHTPSAITYSPAVRLHANPSDWIEKSKSKDLLFSWARRIKRQLKLV